MIYLKPINSIQISSLFNILNLNVSKHEYFISNLDPMKKALLFLILIFIFSFTNAQSKLDSLYSVWKDPTKSDSIRVLAYKDYIWDGYVYSKPDSALVLTEELFEFSKQKNFETGIGISFNLKGVSNWIKGDYQQALYFYKKCYNTRENIGDMRGTAIALNNIGNVYLVQNSYSSALHFYKKSLKVFSGIENKKGMYLPLNNIGLIYQELEDYTKALDYGLRSLKLKEKAGDKNRISSSMNNVANAYIAQEDLEKGLDYALRSIEISKEIGDKRGTANTLMNVGILYMKKENYKKSIFYQQKALKYMREIPNPLGEVRALYNLGEVNLKLRNYSAAISNCKESLNKSVKLNAIVTQELACKCLYEAFKTIGNDKKALVYHEQMLVFNDSLQSEETAKKLQQMEFTKQVLADSLLQVEKGLKVEMVHQTEVRKKDKNKNLALGAGLFFLVLSGGLFSRWRYVKKSKAVIEKEKDRSDNLLLNILPAEIAEELKEKGSADARDFDLVSILFSDFKGFTQASEKLSAKDLIAEINHCFIAFDHICEKYGIEKIKTIGDSFMAAGGLPVPSDDSIKKTVLAALDMQAFIANRIIEKQDKNEVSFKMRLGIHTGPVVAGIVGVKKFQYDIWGDTVNTASRMESSGEIGKVNISQDTYEIIKNDPEFIFESRGKIKAKGKGEVEMYFVTTAS